MSFLTEVTFETPCDGTTTVIFFHLTTHRFHHARMAMPQEGN